MKRIKNYIKEGIKKYILVLLHDYIEKIKEDIKKESLESNIIYIENNMSKKIYENIGDINIITNDIESKFDSKIVKLMEVINDNNNSLSVSIRDVMNNINKLQKELEEFKRLLDCKDNELSDKIDDNCKTIKITLSDELSIKEKEILDFISHYKEEINDKINVVNDFVKEIKENDNLRLLEIQKTTEDVNIIRETSQSKQINEQYVSFPNENIIGNGDKEVKDGTISYDYSGSQIIERVYFDGECDNQIIIQKKYKQ